MFGGLERNDPGGLPSNEASDRLFFRSDKNKEMKRIYISIFLSRSKTIEKKLRGG